MYKDTRFSLQRPAVLGGENLLTNLRLSQLGLILLTSLSILDGTFLMALIFAIFSFF
jgi:hypothetical protein